MHAEQKITELNHAVNDETWNMQHKESYNQLDQELMEAKLTAEKTCQKICTGHTPWTPILTQAIQCILYWKGILKKALKGKISTTVLQRRAEQPKVNRDLSNHTGNYQWIKFASMQQVPMVITITLKPKKNPERIG